MPDALMAAPRPGAGPAENLLKELQQGRKMQMIEADDMRRMSFSEILRQEAGRDCSDSVRTDFRTQEQGISRIQELGALFVTASGSSYFQASESQRCEEEEEVPPEPETGPSVSIAVAETETKTTPSPRTETGGQSQSLSLKSFKSMKTAGTVKFRHQGSQEEGQNVETLSSFTDVSPVNRSDGRLATADEVMVLRFIADDKLAVALAVRREEADSPSAAARMQYDQVAVPGYKSSGRHLPAADEEETADSQLRREVQKSLSAARKADLKVRKLREERQLKEAQWAQFEKDSRAAYLKEKNRFQTALDRIETDIQQTMEQGREASVMVQTLVARGPAALPAPSAETETDGSWEDLIKDEEPSMEAGFLREAMIAAKQVSRQPGGVAPLLDGRMVTPAVAAQVLQAVMANLPVTATEAANPAGRVGAPHAPLNPPPASGAPPMSGTAAPDVPYNSSPKATAPEAVNPGPAVASPVHPRQKPTTRVPVKGTPVRPVHTGTGDVAKLTDKLQAKCNAMQPFGGHETRPEAHRLGTEKAIELEEMDEEMAPANQGGDQHAGPTTLAPDTGQHGMPPVAPV
ncbi:hypothetical protein AK812_SmicGene27171 [Symbiodinium microadriaticum]|uniref:Uncharacterized protein n=1 Tax=Symbiodinium microadriaticum TaxID=2951 RepID=A0A1Q9D7J7_SYMMI|nr:hypothetical protein AK812_SmicGene27171 [Symbiodinium microadriaticum]CAE7631774.1 unnamed protein product [Symbiodinium sp. KB8]